jgi:hypothetical protein
MPLSQLTYDIGDWGETIYPESPYYWLDRPGGFMDPLSDVLSLRRALTGPVALISVRSLEPMREELRDPHRAAFWSRNSSPTWCWFRPGVCIWPKG